MASNNFVTSRETVNSLMGPAIRTQTSTPMSPRQHRLRSSLLRSASDSNLQSVEQLETSPTRLSNIDPRRSSWDTPTAVHPQTQFAQVAQSPYLPPMMMLHSQSGRKRALRKHGGMDDSRCSSLASIVEADVDQDELIRLVPSTNFSRPMSAPIADSSQKHLSSGQPDHIEIQSPVPLRTIRGLQRGTSFNLHKSSLNSSDSSRNGSPSTDSGSTARESALTPKFSPSIPVKHNDLEAGTSIPGTKLDIASLMLSSNEEDSSISSLAEEEDDAASRSSLSSISSGSSHKASAGMKLTDLFMSPLETLSGRSDRATKSPQGSPHIMAEIPNELQRAEHFTNANPVSSRCSVSELAPHYTTQSIFSPKPILRRHTSEASAQQIQRKPPTRSSSLFSWAKSRSK